MRKKVAIIGTGISGLTCAHLLHNQYDITVYEANDYIGGHTATKTVKVDNAEFNIDTGFIVFNDWTYPNFIKLLNKLGVAKQATEMSFSVKNTASNLEYNGNTLNSLFAQRRNFFKPAFYKFIWEIVRFNKLCKKHISQRLSTSTMTLNDFLNQHRFSDDFKYNYILPMCAAIWSSSVEESAKFPFKFFLQFFNNHGLLNITNRPQWYSIVGGSKQYIAPLIKPFKQRIKLSSPVKSVEKRGDCLAVIVNDETTLFDDVIFACHSDQALSMLAEPKQEHSDILGNIPYTNNSVMMHTDIDILPKRPLAWASWNYLLKSQNAEGNTISKKPVPPSVTYNMNILQRLQADTTFCVTLNNEQDIQAEKVLGSYQYSHPQFSEAMVIAQSKKEQICGKDNLYFCGAYWYNGFHEDGVRSALDVCKKFGVTL